MGNRPKRQNKLIEELGKKNDQTFQDLTRSTKMGREAIYIGLGELVTEKIIKRDEKTKRYNLQSEIKNKTLRGVRDFNIMNFDLEDVMKDLREHETPFEQGYKLLRTGMYSLSKITLELHSPGLTKFEKHECERMIEYYDNVIKKTFEVLEEINLDQTLAIKRALNEATTIPKYELQMAFQANRAQKRRADRIAKKTHRKLPENLQKKFQASPAQLRQADRISRKIFNRKLC